MANRGCSVWFEAINSFVGTSAKLHLSLDFFSPTVTSVSSVPYPKCGAKYSPDLPGPNPNLFREIHELVRQLRQNQNGPGLALAIHTIEGLDGLMKQMAFYTWVCLKMVSTPTPNGFADHEIPTKWLFHWGYTPFSDTPTSKKKHTPRVWKNVSDLKTEGFRTEVSNRSFQRNPPTDGSGSFLALIWVCLKMLCTPLYPMVLLIIIPMKNG